MAKTVVGLFSSMTEAQQVKQALVAQGIEAGHISVVADDGYDDDMSETSSGMAGSTSAGSTGAGSTSGSSTSTGAGTESGIKGAGHKIAAFFQNLTGGDDDVHSHYAKGVNEGGALLTATVDDSRAAEVASLLKQHGARDLDAGYGQQADSGTPVYGGATDTNTQGETAIPVVEEQLVVGKREVDRGGVRVYSHVVEQPVETDVTLRNERINVARRAVNRPATAADFAAGTGAFEVRASGEEAVVGKNSRVVEEVVVGKEASERQETVRDSVRKTEVEVEQVPGELVEKSRY